MSRWNMTEKTADTHPSIGYVSAGEKSDVIWKCDICSKFTRTIKLLVIIADQFVTKGVVSVAILNNCSGLVQGTHAFIVRIGNSKRFVNVLHQLPNFKKLC